MQYSTAAMVKAMKIQEVILRAASKQILWIEAADIIGVSYRTMKRWKARYEQYGYDGAFDRRMRKPSSKKVPLNEVETILSLYADKYMGFNVAHFHEKLPNHGIKRGYTFVKTLLQTAGFAKKAQKRGKHRRKRPRKPLVGMMLHLDGSPHQWIPDLPGQSFDLLVLMDDANNRVYDMMLVKEEDTLSCMELLKGCVKKHGIFCSLYSDRASHFFLTPKAGESVKQNHLTQVGRALNELGVTMIPAYSPEARGRSEREFRTLQGRIPNELKLHGIKTLEEANRFLRGSYIKELNKRFMVLPEESGSAFIPVAKHINLDLIFSIKEQRSVNPDNTISFKRHILQIDKSPLRISFAKCKVMVHLHTNNTISIAFGPHIVGRYDTSGNSLKKLPTLKQRKAA
ncbi:ISNCY family transposase [Candidatus Omnitrophota bacterium]